MDYRSFLFIADKGSDLLKLLECLQEVQSRDKAPVKILTIHQLELFTDACTFIVDTIGVRFEQLVKSIADEGQASLLYPVYTLTFSEDRHYLFLYTGNNCKIGEFIKTGKGPMSYTGWSPHGLPMGFLTDYFIRRAMDNFSSVSKEWLHGFNT